MNRCKRANSLRITAAALVFFIAAAAPARAQTGTPPVVIMENDSNDRAGPKIKILIPGPETYEEAMLRIATKALARARELYGKGMISEQEMKRTQYYFDLTKSRAEAARAGGEKADPAEAASVSVKGASAIAKTVGKTDGGGPVSSTTDDPAGIVDELFDTLPELPESSPFGG